MPVTSGIPSTGNIKDAETKRVIDAVIVNLRKLFDAKSADTKNTEKVHYPVISTVSYDEDTGLLKFVSSVIYWDFENKMFKRHRVKGGDTLIVDLREEVEKVAGSAEDIDSRNSVTGDGTAINPLELVNDVNAPGMNFMYGTDNLGVKNWFAIPAGVGGTVLSQNSVTGTGALGAELELVNDDAAPGGRYVYATDSGGTKGWQQLTSQEVVTALRVNGTALEYKSMVIYTLEPDAESGWTNYHTGTTC